MASGQKGAPSELIERLLRTSKNRIGGQASLRQSGGLPEPVARYLRRTLREGQPLVRVARLKQAGTLRTDVRSRRWLAFEAEHLAAPCATGFVWNARVAIAPFLHVRVLDALIGGRGSGEVALLSVFKLAAEAGTMEMSSGALHRYLAEAVWYPTALLPSDELKWSPLAGDAALATLSANGLTVSLEFRFSTAGEVTGIYTPARWGRFGGRYAQAAWEGHFADYRETAGMRIPMSGEVGWYSDGAWQCVWKGKLTEIVYRTTG